MLRSTFFLVSIATAISGCSSSKTLDSLKSGVEISKPILTKAYECSESVSSKHSEYRSNYPKKDDPQTSQKLSNSTAISQRFIDIALAYHRDFVKCDALHYQAASARHVFYKKVLEQHYERKMRARLDLTNGKFKNIGEYVQHGMKLTSQRNNELKAVDETLRLQVSREIADSRESFAEGMRSLGSALEAYDKQQKEMMRSQNPTLICRKAGGYAPGTVICQ